MHEVFSEILTLFKNILLWYDKNKQWIELIKDIVFFVGAFKIIKFISNYNFKKKTSEIQLNLNKRKELGDLLDKYVYEKYQNREKDIGIRFMYWKNYPWNLKYDGFKQLLYYHHITKEKIQPNGYISKTGVNFIDPLWFFDKSIYINKKGFYFIENKGKKYRAFKEIKEKCILVLELPFYNIINFDFEDRLEYEAVFYIRYKYENQKLYNKNILLKSIEEDKYINLELKQSLNIKKTYSFRHLYLSLYTFIVHKLSFISGMKN